MSAGAGPKISFLQKLVHKLFSGPAEAIFKGMATIAFGTLIAKFIGIVTIPLLTRLYGPESFGVLAVFNSILAFLMPLATLRYVVAVPLPKSDAMALNVFFLTVIITLFVTAAAALVLGFAGPFLFSALDMNAIGPYWWVVIIGLLGGVAYELLTMWATRKKDYRIIARTSVIQSVAGVSTKIGLGLLSIAPMGLIAGQVVSQSGGITSLVGRFYQDFKSNIHKVTLKRIFLVACAYRDFPAYRLPSQFILIFSQQVPIIFVASFYGASVAGQLAIAKMLVSLPVQFLSGALTKAAYGELASIGMNELERIKSILRSLVSRLFFLSSAAAALIFFLAPMIVPAFLGSEWKDAGLFASSLSVYLVATIIAVPMPAFVNVFDRQREFLIWNVLRALLVAALVGASAYFNVSALWFISLYGFTMLFFQAGVIVRTNIIVDSEVNKQSAARSIAKS